MDFGWADLLAALPGGNVGIMVARLETRLDDVEAALRATQVLLRVEEDRTHKLPPAPEDAIDWLRDFVNWARLIGRAVTVRLRLRSQILQIWRRWCVRRISRRPRGIRRRCQKHMRREVCPSANGLEVI